jgi:hypothetical protein
MAVIGQRSSKPLKWQHIRENVKGYIGGRIHCTASKLDETWLKSSLAIYVKVQQLDDICTTRQ